jgi:hypothetical protein
MVIRGWSGLRHVTKRLVHAPSLFCVQLVSTDKTVVVVYCSDIIVSVEIILQLTYFYRE